MLPRSEQYLAKAEKCQQISDAADISGTKRLYGVMASQWRQLADEADEADKKPLLEKIRQTHLLREIDKAEGAIRELMALRGLTGTPDLLDRQFHRFRTLEDATGIDADETPQLKRGWSPWPEFGSARAEKARPR